MALSKVDFNNINVTPAASKKLKWNSSANGFETGDVGGSMVLLSTSTASGASNVSFTSGIDSTYNEYIFKFYDMNPATDDSSFSFQGSIDGGSNYNVTATTTAFVALHYEDDSDASLSYSTGQDQAQATTFINLAHAIGNGSDESGSGTLHLFDPSNTTFVKHFISRINSYHSGNRSYDNHRGGYFNTTSAINAIQFDFRKVSDGSSDTFDGIIKMYGVV
tara:strand:- start:200 stop:859 length:660 start_codon:yes stop_codon:yes gene_type:complete